MPSVEKKPVTRQVKEEILKEAKEDFRYKEWVRSCLNCGLCTGVCPSHRFFDFSPRIVIQNLMSNDPNLVYGMMDEYIWACAQCFACSTICPTLNNPGGAVAILREIAVRKGMESAQRILKPYSRSLLKLMTVGTQLSPDMIQPEAFPDWGPHVKGELKDLALQRQAQPIPTMRVTNNAWYVDPETSKELAVIYEEAGVFDLIAKLDPNLHEVIMDFVEEMRESDN